MNQKKLITILNNNLDIGHFMIMDIIVKETDLSKLWQIIKVRGWREALIKKGLIQEINNELTLTEKGRSIYKEISGIEEKEYKPEELDISDSLEDFCKTIVHDVNIKILDKTMQKRLVLKSGKVFNCSVKELQKRLLDFSIKFKKCNFDHIQKAILNYTDDVLDNKIAFPRTILYFIWKEIKEDGKSTIISDMETYIETLTDKLDVIDKSKLFG